MTETVRLENMIEKLREKDKSVGVVFFIYLHGDIEDGLVWCCEFHIDDKEGFEGRKLIRGFGEIQSDAFIKAREQMEGE